MTAKMKRREFITLFGGGAGVAEDCVMPSSSVALFPRYRLKLGNLFQSDGEQFGGLIAGGAGLDSLDSLDCLPEYLFGLGL